MSFKVKLVTYFLLVSLLPLGAAALTLHSMSRRSETRGVDVRLNAGLQAVLGSYKVEVGRAARKARELANDKRFQRALERRDRPELLGFLRHPRGPWLRSTVLTTLPSELIGPASEVAVKAPHQLLGTLVAGVPLTDRALADLSTQAGLHGDTLVGVDGGIVAAGPSALHGAELVASPHARTLTVGRHRNRTLGTSRSEPGGQSALVLLSPQSKIDSAVSDSDKRLLLGVVGSLILIGLVAYVIGGSIVVALSRLSDAANAIAHGRLDRRVPVEGRDGFARLGRAFNEMADQLQERVSELQAERARLRETTVRFGEALAATHDVDQLLKLIVETVVEATGATGGLVVSLGGEVV